MKTFDYKGRDQTGKLVSGAYRAADRGEVLSHLKERGIIPTEVVPSRNTPPRFGKPLCNMRYALIAGGVLMIGAVGWLMVRQRQDESHKVAKVQPVEPARKKAVVTSTAQAPKAAEPVGPADDIVQEKGVESPLTNLSSRSALPVPSIRQVARLENAPPQPIFTVPRPTNATVKVFARSIESYMSQYAIAGRPMPPPPPGTLTNLDEQVREALAKKIEVTDDDTDQTYQIKAAVAAMKEELREVLKNGGSAEEFFQNLYERQTSEKELVAAARGEVVGLIQKGNMVEAKKMLSELNAHLKAEGLPEIKVPPPYRKALGIQSDKKAQ